MSKQKQFLRGMKSGIPVLIGFIPISLTYAMLALKAGFNILDTNLMSILLLAGASQMLAVNMISIGSDIYEIILAVFILNMRHLIMSICVMNRLKKSPVIVKLLLCFGVTDETFAIFSAKSEEKYDGYYFAGLALVTYLFWIGGTMLGSMLMGVIPAVILKSMSISLYAMFIGLLVPNIRDNRKIGLLVLIAALFSILLHFILSNGWSIIIAALISAYAGTYFINDTEGVLESTNE
jgi:4-azaleucine resistance transporter AzlC